jgi:hypothetical protein
MVLHREAKTQKVAALAIPPHFSLAVCKKQQSCVILTNQPHEIFKFNSKKSTCQLFTGHSFDCP